LHRVRSALSGEVSCWIDSGIFCCQISAFIFASSWHPSLRLVVSWAASLAQSSVSIKILRVFAFFYIDFKFTIGLERMQERTQAGSTIKYIHESDPVHRARVQNGREYGKEM
jgi:hypothetical protein